MSRSLKMDQLKMRMIQVEIDGTAGTPAASGFDKTGISQVIDNGVGDYTIVLKKPFSKDNANKAKAMVTMLTPQRVAAVTAVDHDRVTIEVTDLAGAAADADMSILIIGQDFRFSH